MLKLIVTALLFTLTATAAMLPQRNQQADLMEGQNSQPNFVKNQAAEQNTYGWATYADAPGTTPVNGTGGTPTVTWTRTTSSPLSGAASFLLTKDAADRQGEGVSYDFTLDSADSTAGAKNILIDFYYSASAGFNAGPSSDIRVYIYDITNATLITPQKVNLDTGMGRFSSTFLSSDTSTSYRLIFHIATTSTTAYTFKADRVMVSPLTPSYVTGTTSTTAVLSGGNGFGSTNTNVRRYTTLNVAGTGVSCADSSTAGTSCTVLEEGVYAFNRIDRNTGAASAFGIARNDVCTSGMASVALGDQVSYTMAASNVATNAPSPGISLAVGDVIRACDTTSNLTNETADLTSKLSIAKVRDPALANNYLVASCGSATITTDGNYRICTYSSTGPDTFQILSGSGDYEVLVVAGGGSGGGGYYGGGGGAGGFCEDTSRTGTVGTYTVNVGAGGAAATGDAVPGNNGANSVFDTITSNAGARGQGFAPGGAAGIAGGSGGGAPANGGTGGASNQSNSGGATCYGFAGGDGSGGGGGGGGGASSVGTNFGALPSGSQPAGGTPRASAITGGVVNYAGGGRGGSISASPAACGGYGYGGDAASNSGGTSAAGCAGVVIVRYKFQ